MKFRLSIAFVIQTVVAFAALGGSAMSLIWLDQQQAARPLPALPRWDDSAPLVIVDAGHGGHDGGAVSHGIVEKNMALDVARRLKEELEAAGLRVRMTREGDVFLPLEERAAHAARHAAAALVSVHLNTDGEGSDAEGIETFFADTKTLSARQLAPARTGPARAGTDLAADVQRMVCAATGAVNRGTKARGYAVVAQAACPAVLVECGFITSAAESAKLKEEGYRGKVAAGIAQGVVLFLQARPGQAPVVVTAAP